MRYPATVVSTMLTAALATQAHAEPACEALRTLALPNAGVTAATVIAAGVFTPPPSPTPAPPLTLPGDPERDVRAALVRWVEQGVAPDRLMASGVRSGDPVAANFACTAPGS